jgi:RimJ/RimL family protein N-acetyltransferase
MRPLRFDPQPTLQGERIALRPLQQSDREALWTVACDQLLWAQHPDKTRAEPAGFERFFQQSMESGSALLISDSNSGAVIGSSRYYDWDPMLREVAIGYTFLARSHWGGAVNLELKRLMITYAAQWVRCIWFHVGTTNMRSRRAMEKIGATAMFEGKRPLNGAPVDFIYYCIDSTFWRYPVPGAAHAELRA